MPSYHYKALSPQGKIQKGLLEADSERHARQLLREQGMAPLAIKKNQPTLPKSKRVSHRALTLLTRQLATLIAASIPIEEALEGVSEQQTDPYLQYILMNIRSKILEGFAFADALREFPKSFPEVYCASIAAGEHTGKLDIILNKLAEYIENQEQIRQKIKNALIYPLVMIVVSCSIIGFLLTYVVPKMIEVFASNEQSLPLATRILLQITAVLSADGLFILFFFLLLGIAFYRALRYPKFQWHVHRLLLRLPFFAYLQRTIYVARYIHTFSILFGASVPILDTMRVSTKMINNRYLRKPFEDAMLRVQEGISIYTALRDTRALTPMTEHMIASGEKSGQLSNMMERAAAHLEQEVDRIINTSLNLLEPLIIVLMGAMVLFIVLATLLPIFSMEQLVSG